jgi:hypothetical protein
MAQLVKKKVSIPKPLYQGIWDAKKKKNAICPGSRRL